MLKRTARQRPGPHSAQDHQQKKLKRPRLPCSATSFVCGACKQARVSCWGQAPVPYPFPYQTPSLGHHILTPRTVLVVVGKWCVGTRWFLIGQSMVSRIESSSHMPPPLLLPLPPLPLTPGPLRPPLPLRALFPHWSVMPPACRVHAWRGNGAD